MNELKRLQRKLIPVNIVVMILALVAAVSIIFAPLITIKVGVLAEQVVDMVGGESDGSAEEADSPASYMDAILSSMGDMKISFTTYGLAKFAFSGDTTEAIVEAVADIMEDVQDKLITSVATEVLPRLLESEDLGLDLDTENLDVPAILDKFDGMFNAKNDEQAKQAIADLVDELQNQAITKDGEKLIPDDMKEDLQELIKEYYDETLEALNGEDMTLESFICVAISNMLNGNGNEKAPDETSAVKALATATESDGAHESDGATESSGKIYTNYHDLIKGMMGVSEDTEVENPLEELAPMLDTVKNIVKYFTIVMFVFAGIWLIQFLFAFFHLFAKNKRFTMWYTKLLGIYPCIIFGVIPLLVAWIVPMIVPAAAAYMGILGAISTLTWISGACYLLLWGVSIFWAFPIKRKIRKLLRNGASYSD